jgi:tryptophan halogenase
MSTNKIIKIAIVGGGTAGWLTSLIVRKLMGSGASITLIESEEIGILGAGEGSVPLMVDFLQNLNIDIYDFLLETKATHKFGIIFENWNGDGTEYMHEFHASYLKKEKNN